MMFSPCVVLAGLPTDYKNHSNHRTQQVFYDDTIVINTLQGEGDMSRACKMRIWQTYNDIEKKGTFAVFRMARNTLNQCESAISTQSACAFAGYLVETMLRRNHPDIQVEFAPPLVRRYSRCLPDATQLIRLGTKFKSMGIFDRAAELFVLFAKRFPTHKDVILVLQQAFELYIQLGDIRNAVAVFDVQKTLLGMSSPSVASGAIALARLSFTTGNYALAQTYLNFFFQTYSEAFPWLTVEARTLMGNILMLDSPEKQSQAIMNFKAAIQIYDRYTDTLLETRYPRITGATIASAEAHFQLFDIQRKKMHSLFLPKDTVKQLKPAIASSLKTAMQSLGQNSFALHWELQSATERSPTNRDTLFPVPAHLSSIYRGARQHSSPSLNPFQRWLLTKYVAWAERMRDVYPLLIETARRSIKTYAPNVYIKTLNALAKLHMGLAMDYFRIAGTARSEFPEFADALHTAFEMHLTRAYDMSGSCFAVGQKTHWFSDDLRECNDNFNEVFKERSAALSEMFAFRFPEQDETDTMIMSDSFISRLKQRNRRNGASMNRKAFSPVSIPFTPIHHSHSTAQKLGVLLQFTRPVGPDAITDDFVRGGGLEVYYLHQLPLSHRRVFIGGYLRLWGCDTYSNSPKLPPGTGINTSAEPIELGANAVYPQVGVTILPWQYRWKWLTFSMGWHVGYGFLKTMRQHNATGEEEVPSEYIRYSNGLLLEQFVDIGRETKRSSFKGGFHLRLGLNATRFWSFRKPNPNVPLANTGNYEWSFWPSIQIGIFLGD
ncbi:MAG: hypothetical protein JXR76_06905 [Deltaproteobacteria bacterium]|nr:hypothetical protein [Deltaproteobacteria bacterium]